MNYLILLLWVMHTYLPLSIAPAAADVVTIHKRQQVRVPHLRIRKFGMWSGFT